MARFAFGLQTSWTGWRRALRVGSALPRRSSSDRPGALAGPGWYDSSHELSRGLDVREGLPSDAPLDDWLRLWLCTVAPAMVAPGGAASATGP